MKIRIFQSVSTFKARVKILFFFPSHYRLNLDPDVHQIPRCNFQYPRNFSQRKLRDFSNARCIIRSRVEGTDSFFAWDWLGNRTLMRRGRCASVVIQVHFILGSKLVRRCWVQQLEAAGSNVDRLRRFPDSAPRDKVRTWHDSFEARARDVSLLEAGCFFLPSSFLASHTWELVRWLAGYTGGNTYYYDVSIVREKTGNLASLP